MRADVPVVWISHKDGERCAGCGAELGAGRLVRITRTEGIRCMACAGLEDLVFLFSGDAALTRRAIALSSRHAVVVRFSRARKRHERQGVLVEEAAIERARQSCAEDASRREAARRKRDTRSVMAERDYVARFAADILGMYPSCPRVEAEAIAWRACQKSSGRVGRTAAAKALDAKAIELAVRAHVRHRHTRYDQLLSEGADPRDARGVAHDDIERILEAWRQPPAAPPASPP
jgi:hypothetical protein